MVTAWRIDCLRATIPLNGAPQGSVSLPAVATRVMHETAGTPTCYLLLVITGASVTGNSDALCAIPGQSALAGGASERSLTIGQNVDMVKSTLVRLRQPAKAAR